MDTEILSYIPQRPPFVMIGELISADEWQTHTSFTIPEDNLFVNNGFFSESGMIENMAQTAGAGVGFRMRMAGRPLQSGYIAALKNVTFSELPRANDTIKTVSSIQQTLLSFYIVKGVITLAGRELANCEFKIFVNNQP